MYLKYFKYFIILSLILVKGKTAYSVWQNYIIEIAIFQFVEKL